MRSQALGQRTEALKTIGILGGMSWESTALYYQQLNTLVRQKLGGLHSAEILLRSVEFDTIATMQREGKWHEAGEILASHAKGLQDAGANMLVLATNTMHLVAPQIEAATSIPFLHIADSTAAALTADNVSRVGLLGTAFTMEKAFLRDRLSKHGLDALVPEDNISKLNSIIFEELCQGIVSETSRDIYKQAIEDLAARGAQAVILGCTEITLLISEKDSVLPAYDSTDLHVRAAIEFALSD